MAADGRELGVEVERMPEAEVWAHLVPSGDQPAGWVEVTQEAVESLGCEGIEEATVGEDTSGELEGAIREYLARQPADVPSPDVRWEMMDLNGDDVLDGLVYLTGPGWCGTGGCGLLIFERRGGSFTLVSEMDLVHSPIYVEVELAGPWRRFYTVSSGGGPAERWYRHSSTGRSGTHVYDEAEEVREEEVNGIPVFERSQ